MTPKNPISGLIEAEAVPLAVSDAVSDIAEDAAQAAFALIGARLGLLGYAVTGDFAPDEVARIESLFTGFVLAMSLNNPTIAAMQDGGDQKGENDND